MNQTNHRGKSESDSSAPKSTMAILQNEMEKKWEREQAEKEREARLADEPLGPSKYRMPEDDQAFYDFHGGVSTGDLIEWDDGEVNEVVAVVPAQNKIVDEVPLGDIIHVRVLEEAHDADEYAMSLNEGDLTHFADYAVGDSLADGTVTIHREN